MHSDSHQDLKSGNAPIVNLMMVGQGSHRKVIISDQHHNNEGADLGQGKVADSPRKSSSKYDGAELSLEFASYCLKNAFIIGEYIQNTFIATANTLISTLPPIMAGPI